MKTKAVFSKDLQLVQRLHCEGLRETVGSVRERGGARRRTEERLGPRRSGRGTALLGDYSAASADWNHPGMLIQHCQSFVCPEKSELQIFMMCHLQIF